MVESSEERVGFEGGSGPEAPTKKAGERVRRSHAERSADTRQRIIAAVVQCIGEIGFQRTTAAEIANRAGVTWGAVQHHFGGKDGILAAVLEDSFSRFAQRFADLSIEDMSLDARAGLFIDRAWEHFRSPHYRSTFQILLGWWSREGSEEGRDQDLRWRYFEAFDGIWTQVFADSPLSRSRRLILEHYVLSSLTGLAAILILSTEEAEVPPAELDLLKDLLVRGLCTAPLSSPVE